MPTGNLPKSKNINDRCGRTNCPLRFVCAMDIQEDPEFDIEGKCRMGHLPPKDKNACPPKRRRKRLPKHGTKKKSTKRKRRATHSDRS